MIAGLKKWTPQTSCLEPLQSCPYLFVLELEWHQSGSFLAFKLYSPTTSLRKRREVGFTGDRFSFMGTGTERKCEPRLSFARRSPGEMATHSSSLVWKIPWTEEPGRLWSKGSQRVGHDWATLLTFFSLSKYSIALLPQNQAVEGEDNSTPTPWILIFLTSVSNRYVVRSNELKYVQNAKSFGREIDTYKNAAFCHGSSQFLSCKASADWLGVEGNSQFTNELTYNDQKGVVLWFEEDANLLEVRSRDGCHLTWLW